MKETARKKKAKLKIEEIRKKNKEWN